MMGDMEPDELGEVDTTEDEFDEMWSRGEPVVLCFGERVFSKVDVFSGVSEAATADFRTNSLHETRGTALAGSAP